MPCVLTSLRANAVSVVAMLAPVAVVALALVGADDARACGPDFPPDLLHDRAATLKRLPDGPFDEGARHLVDGLVPKDPIFSRGVDDDTEVRARGGARERALYDEGARAFHAGDVDAATRAFKAVLALPAAERKSRSTWAAFMLGRLGDVRAFAQVRALAAAGFDDDLGLALSSFGEEARQWLPARASQWAMGGAAGGPAPDLERALVLYARQARAGDDSGVVSLLEIVRSHVRPVDIDGDGKDDGDGYERVQPLMKSPVGRRLAALYVSTRPMEHVENSRHLLDAAVARDREWPDRLAAALYMHGKLNEAARLIGAHARAGDTPLATWVKAKLAIADGRTDEARALLGRAAQSFPAAPKSDAWWSSDAKTPAARVLGEAAVLSLARGEYVRALDELLRAEAWWQDVAWVAERVLTTAELRAYVDQHVPAPPPPAPRVPRTNSDDDDDDDDSGEVDVDDSGWGAPQSQATSLRALLARRLVREGQPAAALAYFDDPTRKAAATQLVQLEERARDATLRGVDRAEAYVALASLVRESGFDLRATELSPDFRVWGGYHSTDGDGPHAELASMAIEEPERERARSTIVEPPLRYHHRFIAAQHLEAAATFVPARSQAYAALLCQASRYARASTAIRDRLWLTYVRNGATVDFTSSFGSPEQQCPPPDFAAARTFRMPEPRAKAPPTFRVRRRTLAAAALAVLVLAGAATLLVQRRGAPP
jgi:hypothetical protein